MGGATEIELDNAGRMLLPQSLREFAGLAKDIVLAAALDRFEIWDASKYKQLFEDFSPEAFSELAHEVMTSNDKKIKDLWNKDIPIKVTIFLSFIMKP